MPESIKTKLSMVEIIDKIGFNPIRIILLSLDQFGAYKFQIMQLKKQNVKDLIIFFIKIPHLI